MGKMLDFKESMDSIRAIQEYIRDDKKREQEHKVKVLIEYPSGEIFTYELLARAKSDSNETVIYLYDEDKNFESDFYMTYNSNYQSIKFHNGILIIKAQDKKGNNIIIKVIP